LLRPWESWNVEFMGNGAVGQRVAAAIERTPRQDPEPSIPQREELGPWLVLQGVRSS
jgi:hypothetical protein